MVGVKRYSAWRRVSAFSVFCWSNFLPDACFRGVIDQLNGGRTFKKNLYVSGWLELCGESHSRLLLLRGVTRSGVFSSTLCRHIFLPVAPKYGLICRPCWGRILYLVICIVPPWWPPLICSCFFSPPGGALLYFQQMDFFLYPQAVTFIF